MPTAKGKRLADGLNAAGYNIYYPVKDMDYEACKRMWICMRRRWRAVCLKLLNL